MAYISPVLRQLITERARGICEYCQTAQAIVIEMVIDHIEPESKGGLTAIYNLCLSCISCNSYKSDFARYIDPQTGEDVPLFNPRTQQWLEHFQWNIEGTYIIGLTPTGRATVVRLRMNREVVVSARSRWVTAGWHPPQ